MQQGQWKLLCLLFLSTVFSFLAGRECQKRETGPVDKIVLREYMDSLLTEKRYRDSSFELWCNPATRVQFRHWLEKEKLNNKIKTHESRKTD